MFVCHPFTFQVRSESQTAVNGYNVHSLPCITSTDQQCEVYHPLLDLNPFLRFVDSAHAIATRQLYLGTSARPRIHILHRGWPASCLLDLSPASVVSKARAITSQTTTPCCEKGGKSCHPRHLFITSVNFTFNFHSHIYPVVHASFHRGSRGLFFSPPLLVSLSESNSTPIPPQWPSLIQSITPLCISYRCRFA